MIETERGESRGCDMTKIPATYLITTDCAGRNGTMNFDAIKQAAQGYGADMTRFLRDMIAIPSESCGEEGVVKRIAQEMEKLGYDKVEIDGLGNVIGWMGQGEKIIAIDSHIDTVGIGNINNWEADPYQGYEDDAVIYGRGGSDQEGGMASAVYGAKIMKDLDLIPAGYKIMVVGSVQEEDCDGMCWQYIVNKYFPSKEEGVAVAFFYTDKKMANVFTGAYHETTNSGVITKIKGHRTLVEIDGVPALKKYSTWTGKKMKDLEGNNLLSTTITAPLGVKDRLGDLIAIRHPMFGNKDGSMNIGANLAVNTAVIQMEASVDELINSTGKTLKETNKMLDQDAGAYLLVHCGGRRLGIGDRIGEVAKQLKKESHGVPFITVFTFGEYGVKDHGANTTGGLMLSFTAFAK